MPTIPRPTISVPMPSNTTRSHGLATMVITCLQIVNETPALRTVIATGYRLTAAIR